MVDIDIEYEGELRCRAVHRPSASTLITDAPVDNHGRGQAFSPTDLVATALGTCMATTMGILAQKRGYPLQGTRIHVKKVMTSSPPRRIARLPAEIVVPEECAALIDEAGRAALEAAAEGCPVRISLLESIEVPIEFAWGKPH